MDLNDLEKSLVIILITVGLFSCTPDCQKVEILPYLYVTGGPDTTVYEYEMLREDLPGFRFMEVVSFTNEKGAIVKYTLYDDSLNSLSGGTEEIVAGEITLKKFTVYEMLTASEQLSREIPTKEQLKIPAKVDCDWEVNYAYSWHSLVFPTDTYYCEGEKYLFDTHKTSLYQGNYYPSVEFQENVTLIRKGKNDEVKEQINYHQKMLYAKGVGMIRCESTYGENETQKMSLLKIRSKEEWQSIKRKNKEENEMLI